MPLRRAVEHLEAMGDGKLVEFWQDLVDERSNNWRLSERYGLSIVQVSAVRSHLQEFSRLVYPRQKHIATIMPLRKSA